MNLEPFHTWLLGATRDGPQTVIELMDDIRIMRVNRVDCAGLPEDGITCQGWLERLEAQGKATRNGSYWRWAPGKPEVVERQKGLF